METDNPTHVPIAEPESSESDFRAMSLAAMVDYLVRKHHTFTRREGERIADLLEEGCRIHGKAHPELLEIQRAFGTLRLELENHLLKEERVLFPYIALMESSLKFGRPVPQAPFGSTRNPIAVMTKDHDDANEILRGIRKLANDFEVPEDDRTALGELYQAIEGYEDDLHIHIHLENDILFPEAIEMENHGNPVNPEEPGPVESDLPIFKTEHHH